MITLSDVTNCVILLENISAMWEDQGYFYIGMLGGFVILVSKREYDHIVDTLDTVYERKDRKEWCT